MTKFDRTIRIKGGFLAAAMLLFSLFPIGIGRSSEAAPTTLSGGALIRVLLTQLQLTDRLDIALDGSYSVEPTGITFQRGSKLVISSTTGRLMLYYEGMAMDTGTELVLRRHQTGTPEENGMRLNGNYQIYPGDLYLSLKDNTLRAVLHIPLEEYLLGVVPYEMSDSFPLEALKTQAVAARTYALRKANSQGDYDVVDNTNDQVFKGVNASNAKAFQAVLETAGVVATYNGALAQCYYSASNGGQTDLSQHEWGGQGEAYLVMKDDPYDLANPASQVKSFAIPKVASNGIVGNDALNALLKGALQEPLASLGYDDDGLNFRISAVEGVEAHTPKYAEPSRLMTKLRFTVRVEARRQILPSLQENDVNIFAVPTPSPTLAPGATPEVPQWSAMQLIEQPFTVDLNIFPDVETALNLSINGGSNEIVSVAAKDDSFVIEARRFGHGVGMSQRGAEWMAQEFNMNFAQILDFYYPGVTLMKSNAQSTLMPPIGAAFLATPGPPATPTPKPTALPVSQTPGPGQYMVKVTQIGQNSYLNLRDTPSMQGVVLQQLYFGQVLLVEQEMPDGWLKVKTDVMEGYVMASFVEKVEAVVQPEPTETEGLYG